MDLLKDYLQVLSGYTAARGSGQLRKEATPTGSDVRRIWFLCEWLTGARLDLPDAAAGRYVPAVDPEIQCAVAGNNAPRYRVKNNLRLRDAKSYGFTIEVCFLSPLPRVLRRNPDN